MHGPQPEISPFSRNDDQFYVLTTNGRKNERKLDAAQVLCQIFAMALPTLQSVADCADFTQAALPFLHQLSSLPTRVVEAGLNVDTLREVYLSTNPLVIAFGFSLFLVLAFVLISEINRNYSQVDRLWSILPSIYNGHFALWCRLKGLATTEINTIFIITLIWSVSARNLLFYSR